MRSKHPVVGKLLEYRGLKKLLSTYIDALPELINPETGKIHTSLQPGSHLDRPPQFHQSELAKHSGTR